MEILHHRGHMRFLHVGERFMRIVLVLFFLSVSFLFFFPQDVYAYIDPGTGSYFIQLVVATLLGILYFLKVNWKRFKSYLRMVIESKKNGDRE